MDHELRGASTRAVVSTTAGMLRTARFERDGAIVEPFARAPWEPDPTRGRPAHLDVLGAEFAAVPFGSAGVPEDAVGDWAALPQEGPPALPHGFAANAEWEVVAADAGSIRLACDDPVDPVVARLERVVALAPDGPGIDFELVVHARRAGRVPIALHPIIRLPDQVFSLHLDVPFARGWTYPGTVPPGCGVTSPGRAFDDLRAVPGLAGPVDLSRLPLDRPVEDVVLLSDVSGPLGIRFDDDDGSGLVLDWDRSVLPSVMLWLSDRALGSDPWEHRYRGLGVEPAAAAFDLPPAVSAGPNPLEAAGVPTAVRVDPGRPLVIRSSVRPLFPNA